MTIIHTDFQLPVFAGFFQNFTLVGPKPPHKVVFCFNNTAVLDACRLIGKIRKDTFGNYRFFGVLYGEVDELCIWCDQHEVSEAKILTFNGEFVKKVK